MSMSEVVRNSLKSTVKGSALVFAGNIAGIGLWFFCKIFIVRNVTKEELGLYSLAVAVVSITSLIASFGLQDGSTRFISIFLGEGRKDDARAVARSAVHVGLATGIAASSLIYLTAFPVAKHVFYIPEFASVLKAIAAFCVFFVLTNVLMGINRGYGYVQPRVYYMNIGQPVFFLIFISIIFLSDLPFEGVLYSYVLAMALSWACVAIYGWFKIRFQPFPLKGGRYARELAGFSAPLLATAVMGMIFSWTDTLMLGRYTEAETVGTYNISVSLAKLLSFAPGAAGFVFLPIAGELYSKGQSEELKRTFQVLTKWIFIITLPIFFVLFLFPEMTITFLFGESFLDASFPLQVLSIGFIVNVFVGVNAMMLMVLGRTKSIMNISLMGSIVNILLNYILIKRVGMGMTGAALATCLSFLVISLLNAMVLYRLSGMHSLTVKYLRLLPGAALSALLVYALAKNLPLYMWMMPLYLGLFVIGYLGALLLTKSVDIEDVELIEAVARRTGAPLGAVADFMRRHIH